MRFSFTQLESGLPELERQAQLAGPVDAAARTAFQRAVVELYEHLEYYSRLKYSLQTPDTSGPVGDLETAAFRLAAAAPASRRWGPSAC